jgi:hypothetical protein
MAGAGKRSGDPRRWCLKERLMPTIFETTPIIDSDSHVIEPPDM